MALVLGETTAGALALLWLSPLWNEVKRGYFKLTGSIIAVLAALTWFSANAGARPGDEQGTWVVRLALATVALTAIWTAMTFAQRWTAARVVGFASLAASIATIVAMAGVARQGEAVALFQLLAGALFLGAVLDGLLLGHWYLTDRGLSRGPINRSTVILLVGMVPEVFAVVSGGFGAVGSSSSFNPLLTVGALAPWIALGSVVTTAVIATLVKLTLRGDRASAVQSATGFFYLALITAFVAELAAKTRFLPS
jgi:hypothetical protein